MTQGALAVAAHVTKGAVSYWESGKTSPSQKNLSAVVVALGLTMEQFHGRIPKPSRAKAA